MGAIMSRNWLLSTASLFAVLHAGIATAQDASTDAGSDDQIEEIVVSGQKITRSLQDTTASVAVFDAQIIDDQNFIDVFDLLNQTANVSGILDDAGFTIRGLRNTGASPGDQTSDVATVYLDGVFLPSTLFAQAPLNLWDVQSVEVFRGPQSTIQGRNALAGAIVARTVDPDTEFSANGQISYAEFDTLRVSGAITAPLGGEQASFRLAGDYTRTDGFTDNRTLDTDDGDRADSLTLRAKALFKPEGIEDLTVRLNFTYIDAEQGDNRIEESLFPEDRVSFQNVEDRENTEAYIASAEFDYDISDTLSITSVSAFIDSSRIRLFDGDQTAAGADEASFANTDNEIFSQEIRLTYQDEKLDWIIGGYFFTSDNTFVNGSQNIVSSEFALPDSATLAGLLFQTSAPTPVQVQQGAAVRQNIVALVPEFAVGFGNDSSDEIENYAIFGEASYRITERLSLTFGARLDFEEISQAIVNSTTVPPFPSTGDPLVDQVTAAAAAQFTNTVSLEADNSFDAFLPKGAITYDWTDDLSTSISIQRAYRAGGLSFNSFRAALGDELDGQEALEAAGIVNSFDPEFTTNYEFALRSQWFDRRLTVNANAFYIDYSDQQINIFLSSNPLDSLTDNVGESRLFGFELEATAQPTDRLNLFANVGFSDTEFTEAADTLGTNLTGFEFAFAPRWTFGGGGRYTFDNGFFANARIRYTGNSFAQVTNDPTGVNNSFVLADLIIGYEQDNYSIEVFVNNLLDEDYFSFNPNDPNVGAIAVAGAPQTFGVRLTAGF